MLLALQSLLWGGDAPPVVVPFSPQWLLDAPSRRLRLAVPPRSFLLVAPRRPFLLATFGRVYQARAGTMPFVGDLSALDSVESAPMSIDFTAALPAGDTVAAVAAVTIVAYQGVDGAPGALLNGSASRAGAVVTQMIGPGGVPGVTYRLTMTITTVQGAALSSYAHFLCAPIN